MEYGDETLRLRLPAAAERLAMPDDPPLPQPGAAIRDALRHPMGAAALEEIARAKTRAVPRPQAVVVVSDNTRPVPYRGASGILEPIVQALRKGGITDILLLIATGTHRALTPQELRALLPASVFDGAIAILNHDCTDDAQLRSVGRTPLGTEAVVNRRYLEADLKILTGLVEPHFMAGASGGPKSVCPGLAGMQATHVFHGAPLMEDERCASLHCTDNPCHDESMSVAEMAGVDFIVNVTLNGDKALTGVFAGDLRVAHRAAVARLLEKNAIYIEREYDLAVTHAGFAGINHYQTAKAAVEAAKAVRQAGGIALAARHTDVDPVGGPHYRRVLPMLAQMGAEACARRFLDESWTFVPEQWEVQMWGRVFRKLERMENLVYCAPSLTGERFVAGGIPGRDGGIGVAPRSDERAWAEAMMQQAIDRHLRRNPAASVALLAHGPYGVPVLRGAA